MISINTEQELMAKLEALGDMDEETRNDVVCSLLGHSSIQKTSFGYYYCARCDEQIGDTIGGIYDSSDVVVVGHDCPVCRTNYEKLDWRHKIFAPDPFARKNVQTDKENVS